jgi:hypothetical protein
MKGSLARWRWLVLAAGAALSLSCNDSTGPTSGVLYATLTGPVPVRSAMFRLVGKQTSVAPGPGTSFAVFSAPTRGDTTIIAVVAPVGHTLAEGALVTIAVPDRNATAAYSLRLLQVASADLTLQEPVGFLLRIQLPQ